MSNLNELFKSFDEKITITKTKKDELTTSRNALRKDIKKWFKDTDKFVPKFYMQGSYAMKTLINPIEGEYDLDDGVYLQGYDELDIEEWFEPSTVHSWVKDAVDDRTEEDTINKNTCIRVHYSAGYHIDLPIYIVKDEVAYLAHKRDGWIESDPKAFREWFVGEVQKDEKGEQLRRIVKYLKAWKDYKGIDLKGVELTILATNNFDKYDERDDKCLRNTLDNIISSLEENFECIKPVAPGEDLFEDRSDSASEDIIDEFGLLSDAIYSAIKEENERDASETLREFFGNRFPLGEDQEDFSKTEMPGVLKHDGRSA